ncbi:response regulator [Alsobacter sp. SYSU BS001988]
MQIDEVSKPNLAERAGPVLLVDDSAVMRRLVGGILWSLGLHHIEMAENAQDAFERIRSAKYGAVICDVVMGDIDGLQLAAMCHEAGIPTPFIMITASSDPALETRARGKVAGYLLKPFGREQVAAILDQALPHSPWQSAATKGA